MTRVVAMGGGETRPIDRRVAELAGPDPTALFVPTASGDDPGYVETVREVYGDLGCEVEVLRLVDDPDPPEAIGRKVAAADLVYVGGGDTASMLATWREYLVDDLLRAAADDTVLAGLSAGAIAPFRAGYSDVPGADGTVHAARVDALGVVPGTVATHFDDPDWRATVLAAVDPGETVVGIENGAAVEVRDDEFRVLSARDDAAVVQVRGAETADGALIERVETDGFEPLPLLGVPDRRRERIHPGTDCRHRV